MAKRQAGVYLRISQDRDGTGLGVDRQREDCTAYVERRGWSLADVYTDNDVSASTGRKRPEYQRMLKDIDTGRITAVVAWSLDRLHRRPIELEEFIDLADSKKVALGTIGGDVDLAAPAGRLHARIMGSVARHEVEQKSDRQQRAALQAAQLGKPTGGPRPFGFSADGMRHDRAEAKALRKMYDDVLAGVSLREVARGANVAGVATSMGNEWGPTQVRTVLLRARNAGLRTYRGELVGPAAWKGIVPESTWRAAVSLLTNPSRKTSPGWSTRWMGSALYLCGGCGQTVTSAGKVSVRADGSTRVVYRCRSRTDPNRDRVVQHVARHAAPVDDLVGSVVVERLSQADAVDLLTVVDDVDVDALRQEASALDVRRDELAELLADGVLTAAAVRRESERLSTRIAEIGSELAAATRSPLLAKLVDAKDARRSWDALSVERKRAVVDTLMVVTILPEPTRGARTFDPELIQIEWKS